MAAEGGVVTVAELQKRGGGITAAMAVRRRIGDQQPTYSLYVQCNWRGSDYAAIGIHRGAAVRTHSAIEPWLRLLSLFDYDGPVTVYRQPEAAQVVLDRSRGAAA